MIMMGGAPMPAMAGGGGGGGGGERTVIRIGTP
jgi:hypothetical protein